MSETDSTSKILRENADELVVQILREFVHRVESVELVTQAGIASTRDTIHFDRHVVVHHTPSSGHDVGRPAPTDQINPDCSKGEVGALSLVTNGDTND